MPAPGAVPSPPSRFRAQDRCRATQRDRPPEHLASRSVSAARSVLAPFLLTRVLTGLIALLAVSLYSAPTSCPDVCRPSANPLLDAATRWDSGAYVAIAHD